MSGGDTHHSVVRALRDAAPYIAAHRGKTVTVAVPGEMLRPGEASPFLEDITLLGKVAGIRFAIAFDVLPQAVALAKARSIDATGLRHGQVAVGKDLLDCLRQATQDVREALEMILSTGMPGMEGLGTVTGAPLPSRKSGVIDGTDHGFMGRPKQMERDDAASLLNTDKVVLLPPLGKGVAGEVLHLDAREVALAFACASKSDKLVVLTGADEADALGFRELTLAEAKNRLESGDFTETAARLIETGTEAMDNGVGRVHYVASSIEGGLLVELLSPDGIAAMLSRDPFDAVRTATRADVNSIAELIAPGIASGALLPRTIQDLAASIEAFAVVARDDALIACASLEQSGEDAEFGCLAVRPDYANQAYGQLLLDFFEGKAREQGIKKMLVVTTQASDWFVERGYKKGHLDALPVARQDSAKGRSAVVLEKDLG